MSIAELIEKAVENNPVYSVFNNEAVHHLLAPIKIKKTIWRKKEESKRSLRFATTNTREPDDLIADFGLCPQVFPAKFKRAISGDGHEHQRIRTLHSSSLISLLCFYGISESRPLHISFEGHDMVFTDSCFEVKNPVGDDEVGNTHESNMDVVLYGNDLESGRSVVLFLESKFSEYLSWGKYRGISNRVYRKIYAQLSDGGYLERMKLKYVPLDDNGQYSELASVEGRTHHYAGGIKQMVSHFLGVMNAAGKDEYKDTDIYLGEILYRFPDSVDPHQNKFDDYTQLYGVLAEGLNAISESKFRVINRCLTYQEVFKSFDLDEAVRTFYSL